MTRIPLPNSNPAEPFQKGVESGTNLWQQLLGRGQQQAQAQQEWQQHLRNAAIREAQEQRLSEQQSKANPLQLDLLKAKIEAENAKAEKARNPTSQKETPEEKKQRALDLYREKKEIDKTTKSENDLFSPTKEVINQSQKTIIAVGTIRPLLNDLKEAANIPGEFEKKFKPAKAAFAKMIQNLGTEEFQTVFKLPKDQHSVKLVEEMVDRKWGESDADYKKKIEYLDARMEHQDKTSSNILKYNTVKPIKESPQEESEKNKENNSKNTDPLGLKNGK